MNTFKAELWKKRKFLQQKCKKWPDTLVNFPFELWPENFTRQRLVPYAVMRSKTFLVQIFHEREGMVRMSINRTAINKQGEYIDGIVWDELQQLKREAGFGDFEAVEVFPADNDIMNVANMRHLWVFTANSPLDFIFRKK